MAEIDYLPVNDAGRFRPYAVVEKTDPAYLKMLPSKKHPELWLPLKRLESSSNTTLFPDAVWTDLKDQYLNSDFDSFAKTYLEAYQKIDKTYPLSQATSLTFPTLNQLKAEVWFSKWPLTDYAVILYLAALFFFLLQKRTLNRIAWVLFGSAFVLHTLILVLRSYILMRPPVSEMGETVIYVPWVAALIGIFLSKRSYYPVIAGAGIAACLLTILQWTFTAYKLSTVQAVLNSQVWLTVHVLMIVASYGALILGGILGHIWLINQEKKVAEALLQSLYIGIALLIPGTILGGVWAAQSWGRFWDWDPKESWAFISACVYLLIIHAYRFGKIGPKGLAVGSIFGLMAISFTWYGVNYILGTGLHSYGFGNGGEWIYYTYLFLEILFLSAISLKISIKIDK